MKNRQVLETIYYAWTGLPWVELLVASSAHGLVAVSFVEGVRTEESLQRLRKIHPNAELTESKEQNGRVIEELTAYAKGRLRNFTVPLDLRGTVFQKLVWEALMKIPYGETRTYADIARQVGRPKAFRAVGLVNHSNPIAIVVPCHRVIGSNGGLCGYGGGVALKESLIKHERQERDSIPQEDAAERASLLR